MKTMRVDSKIGDLEYGQEFWYEGNRGVRLHPTTSFNEDEKEATVVLWTGRGPMAARLMKTRPCTIEVELLTWSDLEEGELFRFVSDSGNILARTETAWIVIRGVCTKSNTDQLPVIRLEVVEVPHED